MTGIARSPVACPLRKSRAGFAQPPQYSRLYDPLNGSNEPIMRASSSSSSSSSDVADSSFPLFSFFP
jgi:hypothetical protein